MADFMNSEGFGLKIYERFPPRYQEDDVDNRFALRRYLDACGDGGFKYGIDEWNGILDFANPDQATPQALPLLYEQYGLPIFNGIPEAYLRYLLPRLGRAWQKKGGLDVIEFVASALAGVKTNTTVRYDQDQNVDIDLRLEMDYALGDYFPDTTQLYRLLEKFLPFYLGMTIIYSYVFHDEFSVHGEDTALLDNVTYTVNENGLLFSSGVRFIPMTFPGGPHGLNVDFILNKREKVAPDPDLFFDNMSVRYNESGSLSHSVANLSPALSVEVDSHSDNVSLSPQTEMGRLRGAHDDIKDHVVISPHYFPVLNTGLVLNDTFILNLDNCEHGFVHSVIDTEAFSVQNTSKEEALLVFNPLLCLLTNTSGHTLNNALMKMPDEIDVIHYRDGSCRSVFR